jgi:glucoamylase
VILIIEITSLRQPWYLATLAVAEQLYDALLTWDTLRAIEVTPISQAFFAQFVPGITPGTYRADSDSDPDSDSDSDSDSDPESTSTTFSRLSAEIHAHADGFLAIVARHTPTDGGLAEQFDKASGAPASAADLSWSYAAALTAFRARRGGSGGAWGAKNLEVVC